MNKLSKDPRVMFIGYNTRYGSRMYGTLNSVPLDKCIETPVAENLMCGLAMGMSLEGYKPILCFERMDFMLVAADAIINHMYMLPLLSGGQFNFPVIIRAIVGHNKPLNPGIQHIQDYTHMFREYTNICIICIYDKHDISIVYNKAMKSNKPYMIVEYKKLYNQ